MGEVIDRVETLRAVGGRVEIPVLPNPPLPRDVLDITDVVVILG